ncbi:Glycosyltransferase Family 5 protein [Gigaspora rosea]|uniref:Glycosyltransferase Family 5 protein n=1 Tax=Gigaspora rosea TaxID=44941 RepID=A0A397U9B1_9GLOM|nr:Glycosyltransferase Family 5 protein [Gigaspora rosea]
MHSTNRNNGAKLKNLHTFSFLFRSGRRYLSFFILLGILFVFSSVIIIKIFLSDDLIIESRTFDPQPYIGLRQTLESKLPKGTSIYHVTKEFGVATMGGLGHVVTALAQGQAMNSQYNVKVIMPAYSFLKNIVKLQFHTLLTIKIQNKYGKWEDIKFLVQKMRWNASENFNVLSDQPPRQRDLYIYFIGPAINHSPLDLAFDASDALHIYSTKPGLSQECMNLYFCKAAAELITYLDKYPETPLFARVDVKGVDVVHLHGATNAFVVDFLKELYIEDQYSKPPPPIIYTLHDYLEEQLYSTLLVNYKMFKNNTNDDDYLKYIHGRRFYPSALAIDNSQIITFVSETMAKEMVEGSLNFRAKELIIPSILNRASQGLWVGISNGVDFTHFNPFDDMLLLETDSHFPKNIETFDYERFIEEQIDTSTQDLVIDAKFRAKYHLIKEGLLDVNDLNRIIVLYIGRFQYNKGAEFFIPAAETLAALDAKFIVMGQQNNFPIEKLKKLQLKYPKNFELIDDLEFQNNWGILYRAAADIQFVPSLTESFGLIAVEGLLFGATVVSTGVGGLKEFLVNKSESNIRHNSYLFELVNGHYNDPSVEGMKRALTAVINDYKQLNNSLHEKEIIIRDLIKDALKLNWNRPEGPLDQYFNVYNLVVRSRRKKILRKKPFWFDDNLMRLNN